MKYVTAVEILVHDQTSQLLILRRSRSDQRRPGQWDLPGGHVDPEETTEAAAVRELQEETGIVIDQKQLRHILTKSKIWGEQNVTWLFYSVTVDQATILQLSTEHDTYRWVNTSHAADMIEYDIKRDAIRAALADGLL